ncbi:hypothetical protein KOM00_03495 [Geomonas sp. Red69]|uniref:Uncharacterized protein n=1 Tax=Geomonas diazotrophica TaxID=2843197 RepID=A0ABX8JJS1_9BACT|nr:MULTISPECIES: hypothetical protein [Geomonas]MBU5635788.1 hypothetical protein [Geomonas diazotrophica]QWV97978.1 hypothetical protein KP005_01395 [Geomonas nitrogeniifigens]QXE87110.1 hypothetical protein KP003_01495 [Geomonas nitrogeniifigens]
MSTPLIALAAILAFFAIVIIPFMFMKSDQQQTVEPQHDHGGQAKRGRKKKRKR